MQKKNYGHYYFVNIEILNLIKFNINLIFKSVNFFSPKNFFKIYFFIFILPILILIILSYQNYLDCRRAR